MAVGRAHLRAAVAQAHLRAAVGPARLRAVARTRRHTAAGQARPGRAGKGADRWRGVSPVVAAGCAPARVRAKAPRPGRTSAHPVVADHAPRTIPAQCLPPLGEVRPTLVGSTATGLTSGDPPTPPHERQWRHRSAETGTPPTAAVFARVTASGLRPAAPTHHHDRLESESIEVATRHRQPSLGSPASKSRCRPVDRSADRAGKCPGHRVGRQTSGDPPRYDRRPPVQDR
ncbi:hypothetical protein DFR69_102319 [Nocardia neocaledoniensis]|uniref:Uncharacterized protein n=1 Tax=Nocardia neocaledoniensis TaxID=236511 RepID=A0A317NV39_9NOCA|nr:hypothetical protein DFR69_102319 [Nocardia neocaledoniensis]